MRKQLAIGVSLLALTALGGVSENNFISDNQSGVHSQYTHFVRTSLNQFEPLSGASLDVGLPNRHSFQTASVQFITGGDNIDFGNVEFNDPSEQTCKNLGYTKDTCETGYWKFDFCSYNLKYFKTCCSDSYKYTSATCNSPNELSTDSCGGKYKCVCNRTLYPVTKCTSPQVVSNDSCTEEGTKYYSECVCPSNYNQTCTGTNQQGSGEGCTYNGVTKYTACQCKAGYTMTCPELGPVKPSDYCLLNGIKYYNECKTCEFKCSLDSCPDGVVCDYEDCSQKYCDIGCATNYTYWCTTPETNCTTLGYTQTTSDCDGVASIKCPYDTSKVFCLREEEQEEKPLTKTCDTIGDVLYGDGTCAVSAENLAPNLKPIGVVFDTANRLAIALTNIKNDGSAGKEKIYWSKSYCDVPDLANCMSATTVTTCGVDGKTNTFNILKSTCLGETKAAQLVNNYEPNGCQSEFCKKGEWFLGSIRDLNNLYKSINTINKSLIVGTKIGSYDYFWSSTEYDQYKVWKINMGDGNLFTTYKYNSPVYVRPVVKY